MPYRFKRFPLGKNPGLLAGIAFPLLQKFACLGPGPRIARVFTFLAASDSDLRRSL